MGSWGSDCGSGIERRRYENDVSSVEWWLYRCSATPVLDCSLNGLHFDPYLILLDNEAPESLNSVKYQPRFYYCCLRLPFVLWGFWCAWIASSTLPGRQTWREMKR